MHRVSLVRTAHLLARPTSSTCPLPRIRTCIAAARAFNMSSSKQQPEILGTDELKTEAKWLKMERIRWKDEDGKEVSQAPRAL